MKIKQDFGKLLIILIVVICLLFQANPIIFAENNLYEKNDETIISEINPSELGYIENSEILIKFKNEKRKLKTVNSLNNVFTSYGFKLKKKVKLSKLEIYEIDKKNDIDKVIEELQKNDAVEYAVPNYKMKMSDVPGDVRFNEQWGMKNTGQVIAGQAGVSGIDINILPAWDITAGDASVVVGVIDTGTDIYHQDLSGNIFVNVNEIPGDAIDNDRNGFIDDVSGWDFANNDKTLYDSYDEDSHGTHVAGIIAASANNYGIRGVAPNVKIMPLKFIRGEQGGYLSDAIEAIEYAKLMGIKIVNCSWGGGTNNAALRDVISNSGMMFIFAAGNDGADMGPIVGTDLPNLLSVASVDNNGSLSYYSNYGSDVHVAAPGRNIMSTLPGSSYGYKSGTSMAAPFVAGIAALLKSNRASITPQEISNTIKFSVKPIGQLNGKLATGGIVDANEALKYSDPPNGLAAPSNLRAVADSNKISIIWDSVIGAERYEILAGGSYYNTGLTTNYLHTGLKADTAYFYKVRAINSDGVSKWSTPIIVNTLQIGSGTGLYGEYFNDDSLNDSRLVRVDETINFDWESELPDPAIDNSTYTVRWTGYVEPEYSENYTFYTKACGGVRLWINGEPVIDNWDSDELEEKYDDLNLIANRKYEIIMEYRGTVGNASAKLFWSSNSQEKEIVPKYRLYSSSWIPMSNMLKPRYDFAAVALNGKLYALGGTDYNSELFSVDEYNPATDKWVTKTNIPATRRGHSAAALNGKIYVMGGINDYDNWVVSEYDPVANTWTTNTTMPTLRQSFAVAVLDGKIYAMGGHTGNTESPFNFVQAYDPIANKWESKASMLTARYNLGAAVVNGKIYAIGGGSGLFGVTDAVEEYDPTTNKWVSKAKLPVARSNFGIAVVNNQIYVIGGKNDWNFKPGNNGYLDSVYKYDPLTDTWSEEPGCITKPRHSLEAVSINGSIYALGGFSFINGAVDDHDLLEKYVVLKKCDNDILTFKVEGQSGNTVINKETHCVDFRMPFDADVTQLSPEVTISEGAIISPESEKKQNFTDPVIYTVTGRDGTPQSWKITCTKNAPPVEISSLTASPASSAQEPGVSVTLTTNATGGRELYYRYELEDGTTTTLLNNYNLSKSYVLRLSKAGSYKIKVYVKDKDSLAEYDASSEISYIVRTVEPSTPRDFAVASVNDKEVKLSWTANTEPDIAGYLLDYKLGTESNWNIFMMGNMSTYFVVPGLVNGSEYNFRIKARDYQNHWSGYSEIVSGTPIDKTAPATPSGLRISKAENQQVVIAWNANSEADINGYQLEYKVSTAEEWTSSTIVKTATSYTILGLSNGVEYDFRIRANDSEGNWSEYSDVVKAIPIDTILPGIPAGLKVSSVNDKQAVLTWTANKDADLAGYQLEYKLKSALDWNSVIVDKSEASYTITGLINGSIYNFRIKAIDTSENSSAYSNIVKGTPIDKMPPAPPERFVVDSLNDKQVVLSWKANTEPDLLSYQLEYRLNSTTKWKAVTVSKGLETYTIKSLVNGSLYNFRIKAKDNVGNWSLYADVINETPRDSISPEVPTGLRILKVGTNRSITLAWSKNTEKDLTSYEIAYQNSDTELWQSQAVSASATSFTIENLEPNTVYRFRQRAGDTSGNWSEYTSEVSATAVDTTAPTVPKGFKISAVNDKKVVLSWTANKETDLKGYQLEYRLKNAAEWTILQLEKAESLYTLDELTNGSVYNFRIKAVDTENNWSAYTKVINGIPIDKTAPSVPIGLAASSVSDKQVVLTWIANSETDLDGYKLEYKKSSSSKWTTVTIAKSESTYTIGKLINGLTYRFRLKAKDASGNWSNYSEQIEAVLED